MQWRTASRTFIAAVLAWLAAGLGGPAAAVDGAIEINQARALAGGVSPGDGAGFPVTIDAPGSYRLTGPLTVPDENTIGLHILVEDVSIDLNGFAIEGPTVCSGDPLVCTPTGLGSGIGCSATGAVSVRNGTVRGMGQVGISCRYLQVDRVRVISNGSWGIADQGNSVITNCVAIRNGDAGITLALAGPGPYGSIIRGCLVHDNGGVGISANSDSVVIGNTINGNEGLGLSIGFGGGYADNAINENGSTVSGGGVEIGGNVCDDSTVCP